jgi:hypothetical protein
MLSRRMAASLCHFGQGPCKNSLLDCYHQVRQIENDLVIGFEAVNPCNSSEHSQELLAFVTEIISFCQRVFGVIKHKIKREIKARWSWIMSKVNLMADCSCLN